MPFTQSADGTRIYYEVHGCGPAVLFVHGSGGHHAAWWQQVPALADRYCVVTLDLRGFGRSDSAMDEFDTLVYPADIAAVLEAAGVGPAVLVGQSIGSVAALKTAMRSPELVAGVVLGHSLGGLADEEVAVLARADRAAAEQIPVLDRLLTPAFREREPAKTFLFQQMGTFNVAKMADLRNLNTDGPTALQVIASGIPVCFLAGELDAALSADSVRAAAKLVTGSILEIVPGAPHSMYWEAPELYNAALERLLAQIRPHSESVNS